MCGIAGYSLSSEQRASSGRSPRRRCWPGSPSAAPTRSATPTASRAAASPSTSSAPARARCSTGRVPDDATQLLVHVRDYTKGHPSIAANNHPIRHGAVVGIHNGIIVNDDELFDRHGFERAEPEMTVDSEAIFALAEQRGQPCRGARGAVRLDGGRVDGRARARTCSSSRAASAGRSGSAAGAREVVLRLDASARSRLVERYCRLKLRKRELAEGTLLALARRRDVAASERFTPDRSFVEETPLPAVRAPQRGASSASRGSPRSPRAAL